MNRSDAPPAAPHPRAAASLIVLRDAPGGMQVLLLRRADRPGDQNSGAAVFPGGLLDPPDREHYPRCHGLDDRAASARLGVAEHGLQYWVAAVRECFEESGLLFATTRDGRPVDLGQVDFDALVAMRRDLHAGRIDLAAVCDRLGVSLALGELAYHSHWITPKGMPKIFDTRFFVARAPERQVAIHDATENVELLWLTPAEALDPARGLRLLNVTEHTLRRLAQFPSADAAVAAARATAVVPLMRPRVARVGGERHVLNPGDAAYAEIGRLDPDGLGRTDAELTPGRAVWLSPRVLRVTADNGNLMTGPGTNSYFVGTPGGDEWALLDPGPADAAHLQALRDAAPGRVTRLVVTHTHRDHSPGVAALREAWHARVVGRVADHSEGQDASFVPEHVPADGERIRLGPDATLRCVHTPGHASNHICYLLEEEKLLFTGDHLMQGTTVVINPPDGDMAVYLRSLERLLGEELEWLAPGHGFLMDAPHDVIRATIAHRLAREARVLEDVQRNGPSDEASMVTRVYASTHPRLHGVALRSLRAHLYKLEAEGAVRRDGEGRWAAAIERHAA
ncbi:MBL fold metallo-hydrolase [Piscinibacter koreensis]|uniref:MBL fold metallo-hydrolase n=1 Tax=Piscinibacter koreensis TaxID=2742824 RepID=A0A7Y6TWI8_9BURK|nr:MBL fold metallo-hydrolase [Schlegelella koreensis]NUZ06125.1 MBL fold metallo-hydrolase [Schlegelella koreensis]